MTSDLESVHSDAAPAAVGPYSQAMRAGSMLFCSGQVPLDPATGALVEGGIEAQTRQVFTNLTAVLEAGGCTLNDVAATQVFVTNLGDFAALNAIYAEAFGEHRPARATIEVSALPVGASVEISCTALIPSESSKSSSRRRAARRRRGDGGEAAPVPKPKGPKPRVGAGRKKLPKS